MLSWIAKILGFWVFMTVLGCTSSSFGSSGQRQPESEVLGRDKSGNGKSSGKQDVNTKENPDGKGSKEIDLGKSDLKKKLCLSKPVEVKMVFVLDVTESMQESIDLVKSNLESFSRQIQTIEFDDQVKVIKVDIGMITFRDDKAELRKIPFGPAQKLSNLLELITADAGGDMFEGGLAGFMGALDMIRAEKISAEHDLVPIVVVITDTFSHNGNGGFPVGSFDPAAYLPRDCNVRWDPLRDLIKRETFDRLLIYDASPTEMSLQDGLGPCIGYNGIGATPSMQWQDMRAAWGFDESGRRVQSALGRGFGFPFTAEALLETLPADLASSFKSCQIDKSRLVKTAR